LQHAVEGERIPTNPVRLVRRAPRPRREEVRSLAPATVEAMRAAASPRDATLVSVLAYAGLRPSEALALHWSDVRAQTILVQRALSLGEDADTKTGQHRTVRFLAPLRDDLELWQRTAPGNALVFFGHDGEVWSLPTSRGAAEPSAAQ
jgi:integrase